MLIPYISKFNSSLSDREGKTPLVGLLQRKGGETSMYRKSKEMEKSGEASFFAPLSPVSNHLKGVGVMVKLGEKHPWKDKGVHPKSGRMVRDNKHLKTLYWLQTLMGSGAGSRIIPAHGWALD